MLDDGTAPAMVKTELVNLKTVRTLHLHTLLLLRKKSCVEMLPEPFLEKKIIAMP